MKQEYLQFFELLPTHTQLTLRMLVPNRYPKLNTEIFACVCYQHQTALSKIVISNMKECADKIANRVAKTNTTDNSKIPEFIDIELDDDMEELIDNYLRFVDIYADKGLNSTVLVSYISFLLIDVPSFKSHQFFTDCLYTKSVDSIYNELLKIICMFTGHIIPKELLEYGKFLTNQLMITKHTCFGRDKEIQQCIDALCRMKKNNVILVGNAGVGKTSIVHGICNYLQSKECPQHLKGLSVYELDVNKLVSGTMYRGDLEKRLDAIMNILRSTNDLIVFIDEIHTLFHKSGSENESSTLQNALKPFLAENSRFIGCTTDDEYKIIESDKAFERRFTVVNVPEMSKSATFDTLVSCKDSYTKYYDIDIDDSMIDYIIDSCSIYYKNRYFPDKAFDILDKSCVECYKKHNKELSKEDIDTSIYNVCNINPREKNLHDLRLVEDKIKSCIVGQDEAIETVCKSLRRYYLGVNDKTKPIGSYLFVGSTGVGKTELCKKIAEFCFTEESFIRFDMSEFMESHSVSKLIGAPAGYVGFSNGGSLTEKVKHLPFSVVLFDEIEKAHSDIMNILLQIMDDGRLTDSFGNTVNFCNTIIIMTSNIGCKDFFDKKSIGFGDSNNDTSIISNAVNDYFSPEFRNRLDDIVLFNTISQDSFNKIFDMKLSEFADRYSNVGININISSDADSELRKRCFSEKDGVRYITKTISDSIEKQILNFVENGNVYIYIDFTNNDFVLEDFDNEKQCAWSNGKTGN